jgi:hypothetical protein
VATYRATRHLALSQWAKSAMLPAEYRARIRALDAAPAAEPTPQQPARPQGNCPFQ